MSGAGEERYGIEAMRTVTIKRGISHFLKRLEVGAESESANFIKYDRAFVENSDQHNRKRWGIATHGESDLIPIAANPVYHATEKVYGRNDE